MLSLIRGRAVRSFLFQALAVFLPVLLASCASSTGSDEPATVQTPLDVREEIERLKAQVMSAPAGPERAAVYRQIGDLLVRVADYGGAREQYTYGLAHAPDAATRAALNYRIGVALVRDRHPSLGRVYLEKAETDGVPAEDRARFHWYAAAAARAAGDVDDWRKHFAAAGSYRPAPEDPRLGPPPAATARVEGSGPGGPPSRGGPRPAILPRRSWRAAPVHNNYDPMGSVTRITVHHTADRFGALSQEQTAATIKAIQSHHQSANDWADIGYHYLIDPAGRIWEGRDVRLQGAHAGNPSANKGNVGIAMLGHFDQQPVTQAQRRSLGELIEYLTRTYGISRDRIYSHQQIRQLYRLSWTDCPGRDLMAVLDDIRARLVTRGPAAPATPLVRR
jgi:hypothetical protein